MANSSPGSELRTRTQLGTNAQQQLQITANPVNTAIHFSYNKNEAINMQQWAEGLGQFGQGMGQLGIQGIQDQTRELKKKDVIAATNNAQQVHQMGVPFLSAVNAISPDSSDTYKETMRAELGRHYGNQDQQGWEAIVNDPQAAQDYSKSSGHPQYDPNQPDPNYHSKYANDFFQKKLEGIDDPLAKLSYSQSVAPIVQKTVEAATARTVDNALAMRQGTLGEMINSHFTGGQLDPEFYKNTVMPKGKALNFTNGQIEDQWVNAVSAKALDPMNPQPGILDLLKKGGEVMNSKGDQFPSYALRKPSEFNQLYTKALHLQAAALKSGVDENVANILINNAAQLRAWEQDPTVSASTIMDRANTIRQYGSQLGMDKASEVASHISKYAELAEKHTRLQEQDEAANRDSSYSSFLASSGEDGVKLFNARAEKYASANGGNIDQAKLVLAQHNNIIAPDHVVAIQGALASAAAGDPTQFNSLKGVIASYAQANRQTLQEAFYKSGNASHSTKEILSHFLDNLPATGGDVTQAFQAAMSQAANKASTVPTKFDQKSWQTVEDTFKGALKDTKGVDETTLGDSSVDHWLDVKKSMYLAKGSLPDPSVLRDEFQAAHALIGGRYVDTSTLGHSLSPEQTEALSEALPQVAMMQAVQYGLDKTYGIDVTKGQGEVGFGDVQITPVPNRYDKQGRAMFQMSINGNSLPDLVEIQGLAQQYQHKDILNKDYHDKTLSAMEEVNQLGQERGMITSDQALEYRQHLSLALKTGTIYKPQYEKAMKTLESAVALNEKHTTVQEYEGNAAYIANHPVLHSLASPPDQRLLADYKLPNQKDSLIDRDVQHAIYQDIQQAGEAGYARALARSIWGNKVKPTSDGHVGIGYNLNQDKATVKDDFSQAGVTRAFYNKSSGSLGDGSLGTSNAFDTVLKGLQSTGSDSKRLDNNISNNLFDKSQARANKLIEEVLPHTYHNMSQGLKAASTVLAMATGDKEHFKKAVDALESKNLNALKDSLVNVPQARRVAAMGMINLMGQNPLTFKTFFEKEKLTDN